jgi:hypothetical protein
MRFPPRKVGLETLPIGPIEHRRFTGRRYRDWCDGAASRAATVHRGF